MIRIPARFILWALLAAGLLLQGCTARYFQPASAPAAPVAHPLAGLPYPDQWAGLVFNGQKIGFSHTQVRREGDGFVLESTASLRFRLLGMDKRFITRTREHVRADLSLVAFESDQTVDDSRLRQQGRVEGNELVVEADAGTQREVNRFAMAAPLVPMSAVGLYPVVHGLEIGRRYAYRVYDSESRRITEVRQEVLAFERSDLFTGHAFRVRTEMLGQSVDSWIAADGRTLFELSLGGVLIAAQEDERTARAYLTEAALDKQETLLHFSLIPTAAIESPREVTALRVHLDGLAEGLDLDAPGIQSCDRRDDSALCIVGPEYSPNDDTGVEHLAASFSVPSTVPAIRDTAAQAVAGVTETVAKVRALLQWMDRHIAKEAVDVFTALDVLERKRAECQGHALLYAALARAEGIPTRVVNGIVYSEEHRGFLYHAWNESLIDGRWVAVDATFGQFPADATHVRLMEGEQASDLLPLSSLIGNLRVEVLDSAR